jgi:hypothetical protein
MLCPVLLYWQYSTCLRVSITTNCEKIWRLVTEFSCQYGMYLVVVQLVTQYPSPCFSSCLLRLLSSYPRNTMGSRNHTRGFFELGISIVEGFGASPSKHLDGTWYPDTGIVNRLLRNQLVLFGRWIMLEGGVKGDQWERGDAKWTLFMDRQVKMCVGLWLYLHMCKYIQFG